MADPTTVWTTLLNFLPIALGSVLTLGVDPIKQLINRGITRQDERRKEEKEKKQHQEQPLRNLFAELELLKKTVNHSCQVYINLIHNVEFFDISGTDERIYYATRDYDFTSIKSCIYLDSQKLTYLWNQVQDLRDSICSYIYSSSSDKEPLSILFDLQSKFEKAIDELQRMIGFVLNGEQQGLPSHLRLPDLK